jgi:magnesium chelatase family protein
MLAKTRSCAVVGLEGALVEVEVDIARYQKRISGPLLDRIDIHVEVPRVEYEKLTGKGEAESSAVARSRVLAARERQSRRFANSERLRVNADMGPAEVRRYCDVDAAAQPLLKAAAQRLQLSARAFHRVLKLARTIADLAGDETIAAPHIAEALQYRLRVDVG